MNQPRHDSVTTEACTLAMRRLARIIRWPMLASPPPRLLAVWLVLAGCTRVTTVAVETPFEIQAKLPALAPPELPALPQPPPPPRVTLLEGDVLGVDEAITFDVEGRLGSDHQDILAEVASWLAEHPEVLELSIEVHTSGEAPRKKHQKLGRVIAGAVVEALTTHGVDPERLVALGLGRSPDDQPRVTLHVTKRAEVEAVEVVK